MNQEPRTLSSGGSSRTTDWPVATFRLDGNSERANQKDSVGKRLKLLGGPCHQGPAAAQHQRYTARAPRVGVGWRRPNYGRPGPPTLRLPATPVSWRPSVNRSGPVTNRSIMKWAEALTRRTAQGRRGCWLLHLMVFGTSWRDIGFVAPLSVVFGCSFYHPNVGSKTAPRGPWQRERPVLERRRPLRSKYHNG
jgi:hypothetical protein